MKLNSIFLFAILAFALMPYFSFASTVNMCYQETATTSTYCGGLNTGTYFTTVEAATYGPFYLYINYTKPTNSLNTSLWTVKHGNQATYNITLPFSCWNYNASTIMVRISTNSSFNTGTGTSRPSCFNGTWANIGTLSSGTDTGPRDSGTSGSTKTYDENWGTYSVAKEVSPGLWSDWSNSITPAPTYSQIYEEAMWWNTTSVIINTFDEKTPLTKINFNVTFTNSTTSVTFLNQNSFNAKYDDVTFGDTTITISSSGYQTRKYYTTIYTDTFLNLSAYLLSTSSGQIVRFHIVTIADQPIQSVLSTAQLSIGGTYTTVEQATSDSSGTASLYLDSTSTYQITFTHPSYTTSVLSINPTQQDYKITMLGTSNFVNNTFEYGDVTVKLTPSGTSLLRHSPGNTTLNYTVSAPSGDLTEWGWFVKYNGTTLYNSSYLSNAYGGNDFYFVNTSNLTGFLYVDMYYTKTGYNTTWITNIYTMNNITLGNNTLADIFGRFEGDNYGFAKTTMTFWGFVMILFLMGYVAQFSTYGSGVIGWLGLVVMFYAGLVSGSIIIIVGLSVMAILIIRGVV